MARGLFGGPCFFWKWIFSTVLHEACQYQNHVKNLSTLSRLTLNVLLRSLGRYTNEATLEGHVKGTMMSVHNLVSYLPGWNNLVLKWIEKDAKGELIDFPETGFKWNQLGALAQKFYADFDAVPFDQLLKDLEIAKQKIVDFISGQTDEQLYGAPWYEKYTVGRMIQLNTSSPYANARTRLRKWKRQNH